MCRIPTDIDDSEKIVRVVMSPSHIDKRNPSRLKPAAFRSRAGSDDVSVLRHTYTGTDFCKRKGKEIANPKASYVGLAVLSAAGIRSTGSSIHDSRDEFLGHAHISHGLTLPRNEPPNSEDNLVIQERCRALCAIAALHIDPDPEKEIWTGASL